MVNHGGFACSKHAGDPVYSANFFDQLAKLIAAFLCYFIDVVTKLDEHLIADQNDQRMVLLDAAKQIDGHSQVFGRRGIACRVAQDIEDRAGIETQDGKPISTIRSASAASSPMVAQSRC